jgi:hypothetical protein
MNPKEIRKKILRDLYDKRSDDFTEPEKLVAVVGVSEQALDTEIRYLEGKHLLKIMGEYMGKQFLNFAGLKITSHGIDVVENPDEFNRLFTIKINSNHFGNVHHSNINIDSEKAKQELTMKANDRIWYQSLWGQILVGLAVTVLAGAIIYYAGWH